MNHRNQGYNYIVLSRLKYIPFQNKGKTIITFSKSKHNGKEKKNLHKFSLEEICSSCIKRI